MEYIIFLESTTRRSIDHEEWRARNFVEGTDFDSLMNRCNNMLESCKQMRQSNKRIDIKLKEMKKDVIILKHHRGMLKWYKKIFYWKTLKLLKFRSI
jgi:hypothetical protein